MSTDSGLCFDVIMMILVPLVGALTVLTIYWASRRYLQQLGEGAGPDVARNAINTMTQNAMWAMGIGMFSGSVIAGMGGAHKWMAVIALTCVYAAILAVFWRLRPSELVHARR